MQGLIIFNICDLINKGQQGSQYRASKNIPWRYSNRNVLYLGLTAILTETRHDKMKQSGINFPKYHTTLIF